MEERVGVSMIEPIAFYLKVARQHFYLHCAMLARDNLGVFICILAAL